MSEGILGIGERRGMTWGTKEIRGSPFTLSFYKVGQSQSFERDYNDSQNVEKVGEM